MLTNSKPGLLLVDDDPALRDSLQLVLKNDYETLIFSSGDEALKVLQNGGYNSFKTGFNVALLDVMMPGIDGIELLKQIKSFYPKVPIIMVSASNALKTAVQAMKLGAVDFISKPFEIEELLQKISDIVIKYSTINIIEELYDDKDKISNYNLDKEKLSNSLIVGNHPSMQEVFKKIDQVAPKDTTVLITGESGTGKELVAREIHKRSTRTDKQFIAVNCAAIPETLVESELFGHEKGSFTHAVEKRLGYFELANGGTIFLDEIGELPVSMQVKLLRVLQEREFYRVGNSKPVSVDIRVIAATNKSLEKAVEEGSFRKDLFYRIHVVNIDLPPLRKRREDISSLINYFIEKLSSQYGGKLPSVDEEFVKCLESYNWAGNVRELENVIESILALNSDEVLLKDHIPNRIKSSNDSSNEIKEAVVDGILPFEEAEKRFETEIITKALEKCDFVQTKAAELLGISRRILKYKMDKLGIIANDAE